jgi:hypothetical protein
MGIALMVVGLIAIGASFIATFATVIVFGMLLLLGAIFQVFTALWAPQEQSLLQYDTNYGRFPGELWRATAVSWRQETKSKFWQRAIPDACHGATSG